MKVSIITTTFNCEKTIENTILSIKNQNYPLIEHIIIDGESKDLTLKLIKKYKHIKKILTEPDCGIFDAMNKGILLAEGEIIGFLNADDKYENNNVISEIVSNFNKNIDAVYGNVVFVNDNNIILRKLKSKEYYNHFFEDGEIIPHPTLFLKALLLKKFSFNSDFKLAGDFELSLRLFKLLGIRSHFINKNLVRMQIGGATNSSIMAIYKSNFEIYKALNINNIRVTKWFFAKRLLKKLLSLIENIIG